jgi:hypothetical protein
VWFAINQAFPSNDSGLHDWLVYFYFGLYVLFVYLHAQANPTAPKLHVWLFHVVTLINALGVILVVAMTAIYVVDNGLPTELLGVAVAMFLPFLLAGIQSPLSAWAMLKQCIPFYLFLPTMVGYFGAYAFARTWELTWGNRPSDALESLKSGKTAEDQKAHKQRQYSIAATIAGVIVTINFLLVVLVIEVQQMTSIAVWALSGAIFLFALVQMIISTLWAILSFWPMVFWEALWSCWHWCCGEKDEDTAPLRDSMEA